MILICETGTTQISNNPVSCGTDSTGYTGFVTTANYLSATCPNGTQCWSFAQAGIAARVQGFDALGRVLYSSDPESGAVTSIYDNGSSTCGTAPTSGCGDIYTSTDAMGVTTTYPFDLIHRLNQASFSDGTGALQFYYDGYDALNEGAYDLANGNGHLTSGSVSGNGYQRSYTWNSMSNLTYVNGPQDKKGLVGI